MPYNQTTPNHPIYGILGDIGYVLACLLVETKVAPFSAKII
jgi:hypothetical protein